MPSTHLPPSSSAGLVVHWAERNDNVSSSQGPSRSRDGKKFWWRTKCGMLTQTWQIHSSVLLSHQQHDVKGSITFSPPSNMDIFREFQVMRGAESQCLSGLGKFVLSWLGWFISRISLLLPGTLSLFFTLNINEGKHCSDLANQLTLSDILDENGKCEPLSYFLFNITLWAANDIFVIISWYLIPLVSTDRCGVRLSSLQAHLSSSSHRAGLSVINNSHQQDKVILAPTVRIQI